jgi:hypothetical protein
MVACRLALGNFSRRGAKKQLRFRSIAGIPRSRITQAERDPPDGMQSRMNRNLEGEK